MTTMTLTPIRSARRVGLAAGSVAGAALLIAGIWNTLIQEHITVSSPPFRAGPDVPPLQAMHTYYLWYAGTVAQSRGATILGLIGVTGIVLLAGELREHLSAGVQGRAACLAIQSGGIVWIVGSLAAMGGHRAVGLMATHDNPVQTVNVVAFTTDVTSDAFSAAAFVLLAVGMLALAVGSTRGRRWTMLTGATSLLSAVVAYGYIAGIDSVTTYELGLVAVVLLPAWLVTTGVLLDATRGSR